MNIIILFRLKKHDNVKDKFNGKVVKKFPKKQETKDGGPLATIDVCGHIPVI